jgi:uncharacterized membrane protein
MTQWYYVQDGQQAGPVEDATFRQWIAERRIGPEHLIWCEGMAQWQAAATVPGLFNQAAPPPLYDRATNRLADPPTDGTGGTAGVGQLIGQGWRAMIQNFPLLLAASFIVLLINYIPDLLRRLAITAFSIPPEIVNLQLSMFTFFWTICVLLPVTFGVNAFSLRVVCRQPTKLSALFSGFRLFVKAIGLQLWIMLLVFLWSLLLIVPGIIAALRYSQALYLMACHPNLGIGEAVKASDRMMKGHKLRLFCLGLVLFLISMTLMAPMWMEWIQKLQYTTPAEDQTFFEISTPVLLWCVVVQLFYQMFSWPIMANFHRDLTRPGIPVSSSE